MESLIKTIFCHQELKDVWYRQWRKGHERGHFLDNLVFPSRLGSAGTVAVIITLKALGHNIRADCDI